MQATKLQAGRELDALVAEKVMGWARHAVEFNNFQKVVVPPSWSNFGVYWLGRDIYEQVPAYSTEIEAAWQIVEQLQSHGLYIHIAALTVRGFATRVFADRAGDEPDKQIVYVDADTASLAICKAALLAVEHEPLTSP